MVQNFSTTLSSWGERIFNGANGIRSTAREATIFGNQPPPPPPPTTSAPPPPPPPTTAAPPPPPPPGGCTAAVSVNQWNGGFVATVRVTAGNTAINGWAVSLTLPSGSTIANAWNANRSASTGAVRFTNMPYNGRVPAAGQTEFGFQSSGTASSLTPSCTAS
jgi:cellulase/cellobiase CelA1